MTGAEIIAIARVISKFKDEISKKISTTTEEIKNFFSNGVEDYLTIQYQKHSLTKTFLYRDAPVDFYQTFYPVKLNKSGCTIDTENIESFLYHNQFVGILGQAGSGKTMLMKHIFLTSFNSIFKIPLIIEIRNLNIFDGTLLEYISHVILNNKIAVNEGIMKRLLAKGSFIFILDGYDEIYIGKKQKITDEIDQFIDSNNNNHFIISSRPGTNVESLPRFSFYQVEQLVQEDISKFIDRQIHYFQDKELIGKIKLIAENPANEDFIAFIQNPLLLSMFILTYGDHPELPKRKSTFYFNVYDTLATKHDSITKKGGFQHERQSGLQKDDIVLFLKFFSLQSLFEEKYAFDDHYFNTLTEKIKAKLKMSFDNDSLLYDLLVSLNILIKDGTLYTFPHKSLQEFFAAACIAAQGQEFKQKIYTDKLGHYFKKSLGAIKNFWDMLVELDKEYFFKLFIIPSGNNLLRDVNFSPQNDITLTAYKFLCKCQCSHYVTVGVDDVLSSKLRTSYQMDVDLVVLMLVTGNSYFSSHLDNLDVKKKESLLKTLIAENQLISWREKSNEKNIYKLQYSALNPNAAMEFLKDTGVERQTLALLAQFKKELEEIIINLNEEIKSKISFLD